MVSTENLQVRFQAACEYIRFLEWSFSIPWSDAYERAFSEKSWLWRLSLVHPDHYQYVPSYSHECNSQRCCPIRGPRIFDKEVSLSYLKCGSTNLWGYGCPIETSEPLVADHHFPYSLGGPTLASNKVYLCRWHNQVKACDIHLYSWELGEPAWLSPLLERAKRLIII